MFSSIRLRLTLWYLTVFGVLLIAFSTYLYSSLANELRKQFDVSLLRTAEAMANYFSEFVERKNIVAGARETVREVGFGNLSSAIYHDGGILAFNGPYIVSISLSKIALSKLKAGGAAVFLTESKPDRRFVAMSFKAEGDDYAVAVIEPLDQLDSQLNRVRNIILFPCPSDMSSIPGPWISFHRALMSAHLISRRGKDMKHSIVFSILAFATLPLYGQNSEKIYAQKLVDEAMGKHPDVIILAMHVKSPTDPNYPIIAWGGPTGNKVRIGKKADEDDMRVINTGKENLEVAPSGDRYEVELPLQDASKKTIGALGVVFNYKPGDNKGEFKKTAEHLRDELRSQISAESKLFEPAR